MIKAVYFDLDDTLHDHRRPFAKACEKVYGYSADSGIMPELYKKFRYYSDQLWVDYVKGVLPLEELRVQRISLAVKDFGHSSTIVEATNFQEQYDEELTSLFLFPDVPEVFSALSENGIHVGIITNGPVEHQRQKIQLLGLEQFVDVNSIFISDEVGVAKPDPKIFEIVSDKNGISPEESLYIGDNWENDVVGPLNAGWNAIWFNHRNRKPGTGHKPLAELKELKPLMSIIFK